jgi:hypothetical protein
MTEERGNERVLLLLPGDVELLIQQDKSRWKGGAVYERDIRGCQLLVRCKSCRRRLYGLVA